MGGWCEPSFTTASIRRERYERGYTTGAARSMNADCLCGGVRIEITGKLGPVVHCHCSRCRKASGTAFATNADVRRRYWTFLSGEDLIREFESSPGVFRAFCTRCGSPLYSRRPDAPDVLRIRLGILNDDPQRRLLAHFFVGSKAPWFEITDGLPQFAEGPAEHAQELATKPKSQ